MFFIRKNVFPLHVKFRPKATYRCTQRAFTIRCCFDMLYKTQGIVLNYIKYRETSIIVRIYTESFGLASYIINGVRSKKARHKIAFFQPLTLLDMVVYHKRNAKLNRVSELKCKEPLMDLPTNIKKSSIAIFITEILIKSL